MRILGIRGYEGRNIYSYRPVIRMEVDVAEWDDTPTCHIPGFNERLLALLPGLAEHTCSRGVKGGFAARLCEGTYMAHVIEHIAIELETAAGMNVKYGATRGLGTRGRYYIVFEHDVEQAGAEAGRCAFDLACALAEGGTFDIEAALAKIAGLRREYGLGPSTKALLEAASFRGIPWIRLDERGSLFQLGYGARQKRIQASITSDTPCIAVDLSCDKMLTKRLLELAGIPVPAGQVVETAEEAVKAALELGGPVVVKPVDANQGKGVSLGLATPDGVRAAFERARAVGDRVMVERMVEGRDYRVLVVGDKVAAVAERVPAHVVGDGRSTVEELVRMENRNPLRGEEHELPLTKLPVDEHAEEVLRSQGFGWESVPEEGLFVKLRDNANLSTGGTAIDRTGQIHPDNALLMVRAARIVGLDVAGIDLVAPDIGRPIGETGGAVIEVNAAPGLRMHLHPTVGERQDVALSIIDRLFPNCKEPRGRGSRIPLVAVTGTNGKTTVTRMIAHLFSMTGHTVGMTSTDGVYIGGHLIWKGDASGPICARMVLCDPSVEAAVLEVARGGLVNRGLAYDYSDVGVVTNVSGDHLGLDGLRTVGDIADAKALVVECVKPEGCAVLNADDPLVAAMAERAQSSIAYFSMQPDNVVVRKHQNEGGLVVCLSRGMIVASKDGKERALISVMDIPVARRGLAAHNVQNALAAAAAGLALGFDYGAVYDALATFGVGEAENKGRFEVFERNGITVVLDYGHNPEAFRAAISSAAKMAGAGGRVIGVVGVPGDRIDEAVIRSGEVAAQGLDVVVIKEDQDLRGRAPGEVAGLLKRGAASGGQEPADISVILNEVAAIKAAIGMALPGDVVIIFYEKYESALAAVREGLEATASTCGVAPAKGRRKAGAAATGVRLAGG